MVKRLPHITEEKHLELMQLTDSYGDRFVERAWNAYEDAEEQCGQSTPWGEQGYWDIDQVRLRDAWTSYVIAVEDGMKLLQDFGDKRLLEAEREGLVV